MNFILVGKYKNLTAVNVFFEVSFNYYRLGFHEYIEEFKLVSLRNLLISYVNSEAKIRYPLFTSNSLIETLINAGYHDDQIPLDEIERIDFSYTNVVSFDSDAFQNIQNVRFIDFPESLEVIPNRAFLHCQNLKLITIPKNLLKIGEYAFYGCSGLSSVIIPSSVSYIGENAFNDLDFIIAEFDKKPIGWHDDWAGNTKRIHWVKK